MISTIYNKAFNVIAKKPLKLWGLSLLNLLLVSVASVIVGPVPFLSIAVSILLEVGMIMIYLRAYNGEEYNFEQMFDCFKDWNTIKRVLGGICLSYLWVFLWALIPIAGIFFSIKKIYEYRFVPYILMREPNVSIKESIELSKSRTFGHKKDMFWADIAWLLIVGVAIAIFAPLSSIKFVGWIFCIALIAVILILVLLGPLFAGLVETAYYVEICGNKENYSSSYSSNRHCENCGAPMKDIDSFCSSCGAKDGKKKSTKKPSQ